ncbi:MAG: efflux RND transporter periplasmic adaptor subunit [Proteobacteria bacterium]|nr:efflux RND transporter periplasmic adaptor subunit [Pseudomonadota bacterium]
MRRRSFLVLAGLIAGLGLAVFVPRVPQNIRHIAGLTTIADAAVKPQSKTDGHGHAEGADEEGHGEGKVTMTPEQVTAAGIQVMPASSGALVTKVSVPGVLAANADHLVRITARVPGTIAEVRKRLGDMVEAGQVLAVIESREIADAKGEHLAATRVAALANVTLVRETKLWKQRISPEQDYLRAKAATEEASIRVDLARQRLSALGLPDEDVARLANQPVANLRRLELRAPIAGRVIARAAVQGAAVTADAELFSVADLSAVWIEMTIPTQDLPLAREGLPVTIREGSIQGQGRIVFLSPVLDPDTRAARAVAEIDNASGQWRPGGFVTAELATAEQAVDVLVPRSAVQEVQGEKIVFVRTPDGFERRDVAIGREDAAAYEIVFGLDAGTDIATGNVFSLKAELSKSEAGHSH